MRYFRAAIVGRVWRWTWRLALGVLGALICAIFLWVVVGGRARHDHFALPRAAIIDVAQERDEVAGSDAVALEAADGFGLRLRVVRDFSHESPRPVVVILGGHRTGRAAASLVGDPGTMAVVAVDYPYNGPVRIRSFRQVARHTPEIQQALLDTPRALSQALDWILAQPWADAAQVELVGVSLGAPFVAVAGANDARFTRIWIIQAGADNEAWINRNLERKIPQAWLRNPAAMLVHRLAHGASFTTAEWIAKIAPRPVVVIGARDDQRLPQGQVERLFAAANEPKELVWVDGLHVSPRHPESVRRILDVVRARL